MTLTKSQIERLGVRLVRSNPPAAEDLAALHELLLSYGDALEEAVTTVQRSLGITPSSRVKTTGTILEKLERYGGSWLKSIQDLAGMRIVGTFDRRGQDALVAQLVELFSDGKRAPRVVDRREEPSHGYRAVHVIVSVRSLPVEIQIRTPLQHEWADLFEKLADRIGRNIRYGEPPQHWLSEGERQALSRRRREIYDLVHGARSQAVTLSLTTAEMVSSYEEAESLAPELPVIRKLRAHVDRALSDLTEMLEQLSSAEAGLITQL